jgi:plastocyanin
MKTSIGSKIRILVGSAILLLILIISIDCSKSTSNSGTPGTDEVLIQNMAFDPVTITVSANTTITWTNKDGVPHTVTSNNGLFDSGPISTNGTFSHLFATSGSFPYHCTVHPSMTATVIVN